MIFRYKSGASFLHKIPTIAKIVLVFPMSILIMKLAPLFCIFAAGFLFVLGLLARFTIKEQAANLKPAVYYFLFLYALSVVTNLSFSLHIFIPNKKTVELFMRLIVMMQVCSLLFMTSTSMEIREALERMEGGARGFLLGLPWVGKFISRENSFSVTAAFFLSFIPYLFELWALMDRAWRARGGKKSLMIKNRLFVFMKLSFHKAYLKSRAAASRLG